MLAIARIPFCALHFSGCICAIIYRGREYRLATYNGVKILSADEGQIELAQGSLKLKAEIRHCNAGHALKAPSGGQMTDTIRERVNVQIHVILWQHGQKLFDLRSPYAAYEYVAAANSC